MSGNKLRGLCSGPTVAAKLVEYDNRPAGFDYLRLGLSLSVMIWHSFFLSYAQEATHNEARVIVLIILPMFFTLSGFLISGSLLRTKSISEFLTLRAVRIMPALSVEVVLSAFVVGFLFTTLPLARYFSSREFMSYFLNVFGDIHFFLPGVFKDNPTTRVNGSLWTIPYELYCYISIALLWIAGAIRKPKLIIWIVIAMQIMLPLRDVWRQEFIKFDESLPGRMLVLAFLFGVALYFYRDRIVLRRWMFVTAAIASVLLLRSVYTSYFVALPAAYMTMFIGLTNPKRVPIVMDGDYSYGIYLYASPIQQAVLATFPAHREWWFNLAVAIIPTCLFAAFSWHVIEKPILQHRKKIVGFVSRIMASTKPIQEWVHSLRMPILSADKIKGRDTTEDKN